MNHSMYYQSSRHNSVATGNTMHRNYSRSCSMDCTRTSIGSFGDRPARGTAWCLLTPSCDTQSARETCDDTRRGEWKARSRGGTTFMALAPDAQPERGSGLVPGAAQGTAAAETECRRKSRSSHSRRPVHLPVVDLALPVVQQHLGDLRSIHVSVTATTVLQPTRVRGHIDSLRR